MFNILNRATGNSLFSLKRCTMALRAFKKRSIFEQTNSNPYHIYPWRYEQHKPQEIMNDANYTGVPEIASPTKYNGKRLIFDIEQEELKNIKNQRDLKRDEIFVGDTIEVEYYHSITSKKIYKYKGVVLEIKRPKSLTYSFKFLSLVAGTNVVLEYPFYSPMLASVKVINKGRFGYKRKMYHIRNVNHMGSRLQDIMKGGKNVNLNKRAKQRIKKIESQKEAIIME